MLSLVENKNNQSLLWFIENIYPAFIYPTKEGLDLDYLIIEEMYGFLGEVIYHLPVSLKLFLSVYNQN